MTRKPLSHVTILYRMGALVNWWFARNVDHGGNVGGQEQTHPSLFSINKKLCNTCSAMCEDAQVRVAYLMSVCCFFVRVKSDTRDFQLTSTWRKGEYSPVYSPIQITRSGWLPQLEISPEKCLIQQPSPPVRYVKACSAYFAPHTKLNSGEVRLRNIAEILVLGLHLCTRNWVRAMTDLSPFPHRP